MRACGCVCMLHSSAFCVHAFDIEFHLQAEPADDIFMDRAIHKYPVPRARKSIAQILICV